MVRVTERQDNFVALQISGKLEKEDFVHVMPQLESAMSTRGPLRVVIVLDDFRGFAPSGALQELTFDLKHRKDFKKVAVVGARFWDRVTFRLMRTLFRGKVRFFDKEKEGVEEAKRWVTN